MASIVDEDGNRGGGLEHWVFGKKKKKGTATKAVGWAQSFNVRDASKAELMSLGKDNALDLRCLTQEVGLATPRVFQYQCRRKTKHWRKWEDVGEEDVKS